MESSGVTAAAQELRNLKSNLFSLLKWHLSQSKAGQCRRQVSSFNSLSLLLGVGSSLSLLQHFSVFPGRRWKSSENSSLFIREIFIEGEKVKRKIISNERECLIHFHQITDAVMRKMFASSAMSSRSFWTSSTWTRLDDRRCLPSVEGRKSCIQIFNSLIILFLSVRRSLIRRSPRPLNNLLNSPTESFFSAFKSENFKGSVIYMI